RPNSELPAKAKMTGTPAISRTTSTSRAAQVSMNMLTSSVRGSRRGGDAPAQSLDHEADADGGTHEPEHQGAEAQWRGGQAEGVVAEELGALPAFDGGLPAGGHEHQEDGAADAPGQHFQGTANERRHAVEEEGDAQ